MRCTQESDGENTYEEVDHMSLLQALLLGLVQGITEFLPVSSSGHLAIMQNLLNINTDTGVLLDVILHLGTLTAIFIAFWKDIKKLILDGCGMIYDIIQNIKIWSHNRREHDARRYRKIVSSNYRKFILLITVSTIPTAIVGLLLQNVVETAGSNLLAPGVGLFITGILLLVVDFFPAGDKIPKDVSFWIALAIGFFQGIAVFPGISRSGMTIAACLLCGLNRKFAVKYSFIMSIPAVLGAAVLELKDIPGSGVTLPVFGEYLAAAVLAGTAGYFCIKTMLRLIQRKKFRYFSIYCFIIGIVAVTCNFVL